MKILHTITAMRPEDGGPSRSVPALANAEARHGHDVQVFTTGAATIGSEAAPSDAAAFHYFPRSSPKAFGRSGRMAKALDTHKPDIVHHHAIWHRTLHYAHQLALRTGAPLVISPRGMMLPWAWQHHRKRKDWANRMLHPGAFAAASGWHATSAEEASAIRALGFTQPIAVVGNGVDLPSDRQLVVAREHWTEEALPTETRRVALFYSRFHAKKRVIECIDLWGQIAPPDWMLLMVGLPDQFTARELDRYVLQAGHAHSIKVFNGVGRPPPYAVAELLILPSHSENFGMVVAEALAAGIPAVCTDSMPWTELNGREAGWCMPWATFEETLREVLQQTPDVLAAMGRRGRDWMMTEFSWQRSAGDMLDFYTTLRPSR